MSHLCLRISLSQPFPSHHTVPALPFLWSSFSNFITPSLPLPHSYIGIPPFLLLLFSHLPSFSTTSTSLTLSSYHHSHFNPPSTPLIPSPSPPEVTGTQITQKRPARDINLLLSLFKGLRGEVTEVEGLRDESGEGR